MCGIVGIINSCPAPNVSKVAAGALKLHGLLRDMLLASAVRGTDGTGLFQVMPDGTLYNDKMAVASGYAVDASAMSAIIKDAPNATITVGHVRAATRGSVRDENCHPFTGHRDDGSYIIGVHNGTLYGWDTPKTEFDVDSEWAFNEIAKHGDKAFEEFFGAYAMMWYDTKEPHKVFFIRNDDRPLHLARTADKRSIIFASEAGMLQWLCDKHNVAIGDIYSVDEDGLYSIDTTSFELEVTFERKIEGGYDTYSQYGNVNNRPTIGDSCALPFPLTPSSDYDSAPSSWSLQKIELVDKLKTELRSARWSLSYDQMGEQGDGPVEAGPVDGEADPEFDYMVKAKGDWFSDRYIDHAEVARAKALGVHGVVVEYEGVDFDKFTDSVVGEIVSPLKLNMALAYVTNLTPFEADNYTGKPRKMVVAGARPFGNEMEYVLVELTEKGEEALAV